MLYPVPAGGFSWYNEVIRERGGNGRARRNEKRHAEEKLKLDQMMRVLFKLSKKVIVHLMNGLFEERFSSREVAIRFSNGEFVNDAYDRIMGDLFVTIQTKTASFNYHVEFQTLNDQSMVIRMFRYGFEKAVELGGTMEGNAPAIVEFPRQLVIFLEENEAIGDELSFILRLPDGTDVDYKVPVLKYWTYTAEELANRKMFALLPLQVFRSRKRMKAIYDSGKPESEKSRLMTEEFERLKDTIERTVKILGRLHDQEELFTGDLERILRVIYNITEYLYSRYGGYETINKEGLRMIKTLFDPRVKQEGIKEGKKEGIKEGKKEGIKEGKLEVARNLLSMDADPEMIQKATGLTREDILNLQKK